MADKKKKEVKVRDLKPSKDAKGGAGRSTAGHVGKANLSGAILSSSQDSLSRNRNKLN